jgi:hypothetical protein
MRNYLKAFAFVAVTGGFIFAQSSATATYAANSKSVDTYTTYDLAARQDTTPTDTTKKKKKEKKEKEDTSATRIISIR